MSKRILVAVLATLLHAAPAARAADNQATGSATCSGTLSGAVTGTFECTVKVLKTKGSELVTFEIKPDGPVKGLKSIQPGSFAIKGVISPQTYGFRDLVKPAASAVTDSGKKFATRPGATERGDFEVQVESVEHNRNFMVGYMRIHSHLVPVDAKDKAEIQVVVEALTAW